MRWNKMSGEYRLPGVGSILTVALFLVACESRSASNVDTSSSQIASSDSAPTPPPVNESVSPDTARPVADTTPASIVQRYYAAIQARRYADAYRLWSDSGRASGKTPAQFAGGFGSTTDVHVTIGDNVHIEGAAGSQYATVPVVVDATLRDGERQHFVGDYVLRRAMVDGATAEQRAWRIETAHLHK